MRGPFEVERRADGRRQGDVACRSDGRDRVARDSRGRSRLRGWRDHRHASRRWLVNLLAVSVAELRETTMARRRPHDPVSVLLGRHALVVDPGGRRGARVELRRLAD